MSQTFVIEDGSDEKELEAIRAKYEEILCRFASTEPPPTAREKVLIEQKIYAVFEKGILEEKTDSQGRNTREDIADAVTAVSAILSGITAVRSIVDATGVTHDISSAVSSLMAHSMTIFGTVSAFSPILLMIVSLWNVFRALQTGRKIKAVHNDFIKWDKYYMAELNKSQASVEAAVEELSKYFVKRNALLRMKDASKTPMLEYELGQQMARCMSQIEYKLRRYQNLIDKAEQTLKAIEARAVEAEKAVGRQKRRGWLTVAAGSLAMFAGVAMIVTSGGTAIPIATAILGFVATAGGVYVIRLSNEQLETLRDVCENISLAKNQLNEHKKSCKELEERILDQIRQSKEFVSEAEVHAENEELRRQLAEAQAQNEAVENRLGSLCVSSGENKRKIVQVMAKYKLEKHCDFVMEELGIEEADDLEMIDEEMLEDADLKPIVKKRLVKMAKALARN